MADCTACFQVFPQENELKYGIWGIRFYSQILGLLLMFCLGFIVLQFGSLNKATKQFIWEILGKSRGLRKVFPLKQCLGQIPGVKTKLKILEKSKSISTDLVNGGSDRRECFLEDKEIDVMTLRKLVKMERKRANAVCADLEKERMAAASAADEAMAMILRLQSEKSVMEIETNQFRRMAERRQEYDQEVIQSLQWLVMKYESDVKLLEDELQKCRTKLALYVEDGEINVADWFKPEEINSAVEEDGSASPITSP